MKYACKKYHIDRPGIYDFHVPNEKILDVYKPGRIASPTAIHSDINSVQYQVTTFGLHRFRMKVFHIT